VRLELQRRTLTPLEKRRRDVLIPMTAAAAQYLVYLGVAFGQEFVAGNQDANFTRGSAGKLPVRIYSLDLICLNLTLL
jgi:hypothetical protein